METSAFNETQQNKLILWIGVIASAATFIVCGVVIPDWWGWGVGFLAGLVEYVLVRITSRMDTFVTPTRVVFGMPLFKKKLPLSEIQVGEIEKIPLMAGVGIHYFGGRWVYNAHLGRGVALTAHNTRYLVGSEKPEQLQSTLLQFVRPRTTR